MASIPLPEPRRFQWPTPLLSALTAGGLGAAVPTAEELSWEPPGPSSRRTGLTISEIHYHPSPRTDGRDLEFIELYNSNPWVEELTGWRLTGDVTYEFGPGVQIASKGYLVVARVPADVQAVHGLTGVLGGFAGSLSNAGDTVQLVKPSGAVVLEVNWVDRAPWPVAADGTGHSLVLARPSHGERSPAAWDASPHLDGSPGAGDTPPASPQDHIVINEVLANSLSPSVDFIELRNDSPDPVDISGCRIGIDDGDLDAFVVPPGTVLDGSAVVSFNESQLGFGLAAGGDAVYFTNTAGTRVLECLRFPGAPGNISLGRGHDRPGAFRTLATPTPGSANAGPRQPEILISEIYFDPITGDDLDEWLELHNPGPLAVDLSGWRFSDGIDFLFPAGTTIDPGGWLVVARDAARTRANHPSLDPGVVMGDFIGSLANRGERLTLVQPVLAGTEPIEIEIDTVTYQPRTRGHRWSAGGGSSLEVTDLRADRTLDAAWADSDESAKAGWTSVSATGRLDHGHSGLTGADRVHVFLMGEGEALVDDVVVAPIVGGTTGPNALANGGFESGIIGWSAQGNQSRSSVASGQGVGGGNALHLRSSDDGDPDGNRVSATVSPRIVPNATGTVTAQARWLRGHPELILRLKGGYLETLTTLDVPKNLGTPGARNSRAVANGGPAIREVNHRPLLPPANTPINVFARVSDTDGVGAVTLRWRVEPGNTFTDQPMLDDGQSPDLVAGDGTFSGSIPSQSSGRVVIFRVESADTVAVPAFAVFPPDAPAHECLVRVGDPARGGDFAAYRMWIAPSHVTRWASREKFGNEPIDTTFIYAGVRAVYGCGAWYAGSEASTPGFSSPVGSPLCGYHLAPPADDLVLGEDNFKLDFPVRDPTDQREVLMFWMAEQLRLPNLYRRYIHLYINGTRRGTIYDDVQQPGQGVVDEFFPADSDGNLYKTNNWTEGTDNANSTSSGEPNILRHFDSAGAHKLARYRWTWRPRAARSANEFSPLFELIDAVNVSPTNPGYQATVEAVVDVENWMRTFAFHDLCSYWDGFGNPNHKNTFLYKPQTRGWTQFTWDMDVGLGVFNDPVNAPLFPGTVDSRADLLQGFPAFRRIYWRTISEAFSTFFSGNAVMPQLQRRHAAFIANGISLTSPFVSSGAYGLSVTQWIDQRRAFIQSQLDAVTAPFAITSPSSAVVVSPSATITGTAPVEAKSLTVNGAVVTPVWTSVTAWRLSLAPAPGSHAYVIRALDAAGGEIGSGTVTIDFTEVEDWPALRINEWAASNLGSVLDPADGEPDDWIEIFNPTASTVSLAGWRIGDSAPTPTEFIIPSGFSLPAGGRLVAWCDQQTAQTGAPNSLHLPIALAASGETLTLSAPDGTLIDRVTLGQQMPDVSQGRIPDGGGVIDFLAAPSAGTPNSHALPPPSFTDAIAAAGGIYFTVAVTPGFLYQLQARDSLLEGEWTALGAPLTAAGPTLSFSDLIGARRQRFYRIVRTP